MREVALQELVLEFQELVKQESKLIEKKDESQKLTIIKSDKNRLYERIEDEYKFSNRIKTWYDSYQGLFDTYDDFLMACKVIFYETILKYKTLEQRVAENKTLYEKGEIKKSKIKPVGNGEINTFFAYMLRNKMVNSFQATQAQQRNPKVCCPICHKHVSPFKKHLKEDHQEYFEEAWNEYWGKELSEFEQCPICGASPKNMFDHITARHPNTIYDLFHKEFAGHIITEQDYSLDYRYNNNNEDNEATLQDMLSNSGEAEIVDKVAYKKMLGEIWQELDADGQLILPCLLAGFKRQEICNRLNWDTSKYLKVRTSLKRNTVIKNILSVQ